MKKSSKVFAMIDEGEHVVTWEEIGAIFLSLVFIAVAVGGIIGIYHWGYEEGHDLPCNITLQPVPFMNLSDFPEFSYPNDISTTSFKLIN